MVRFTQALHNGVRALVGALVIGCLVLSVGLNPAYAGDDLEALQYIAADGQDLTAIAQCLPKELSQPSLERALRESGNDFLQKVFSTKDNYQEYKIDQAEAEYLSCLKSKGFVSQVNR